MALGQATDTNTLPLIQNILDCFINKALLVNFVMCQRSHSVTYAAMMRSLIVRRCLSSMALIYLHFLHKITFFYFTYQVVPNCVSHQVCLQNITPAVNFTTCNSTRGISALGTQGSELVEAFNIALQLCCPRPCSKPVCNQGSCQGLYGLLIRAAERDAEGSFRRCPTAQRIGIRDRGRQTTCTCQVYSHISGYTNRGGYRGAGF